MRLKTDFDIGVYKDIFSSERNLIIVTSRIWAASSLAALDSQIGTGSSMDPYWRIDFRTSDTTITITSLTELEKSTSSYKLDWTFLQPNHWTVAIMVDIFGNQKVAPTRRPPLTYCGWSILKVSHHSEEHFVFLGVHIGLRATDLIQISSQMTKLMPRVMHDPKPSCRTALTTLNES